jgi:hypothetical protein
LQEDSILCKAAAFDVLANNLLTFDAQVTIQAERSYSMISNIILGWILERWDGVMWTGLVWLRIGTGGELL